MPTYEYRCESCGRTSEVVQSIHDAPLTMCEDCGGALRKVYAPVGIVFKGSGFYKTDSRSSSKSSPKADSAKGEGTGSESSKPDGSGSAKESTSASKDAPAPASAPAASKGSTTPPAASS